MEVEGEIESVLEQQREELMAAKTLDSDFDLAFSLQMQEALTASLTNKSSPSTSHSPPPPPPPPPSSPPPFFSPNEDVLDYTTLLLQDLDRFSQERLDHLQCETQIKRMKLDLDRRIHDQKFARDIMNIPEDQWANYGDNYQRPYGDDGDATENKGQGSESCRMYFKGLVSEERIGDANVAVAAIGVAICDFKDNVLFEVMRGLEDGDRVSSERAELEALVTGLETAMALSLERVTFFCDNYMVYQYVTRRLQANQSKMATLVNQVADLQKRFAFCEPSFVGRNEIKYAFKLARTAIVSQLAWPMESKNGKSLKETCAICFEDIDVAQMFSVDGCLHRFCFSCMKQHVEVKLLNGMMAKCPREGCETDIDVDSCKKFLDPRLVEIMSNRMKEASIAVKDKIYCPFPKCSALMSKHEVLEYTKHVYVDAEKSRARKCMKCYKFFCINCKAPWHYDMTCYDYKQSPRPQSDDSMVKSLAQKKQWRQCVRCNHMVELAAGCYHITCRCGYEFCYTCGAEWKNKKATCTCPIWDERNIIRDGRRR